MYVYTRVEQRWQVKLNTMTNIVMLKALVCTIGIVLVYAECQTNGGPIESCCCLGYSNTQFNAKSSGVYIIAT